MKILSGTTKTTYVKISHYVAFTLGLLNPQCLDKFLRVDQIFTLIDGRQKLFVSLITKEMEISKNKITKAVKYLKQF